jgi:hypothetical protein
MVVMIDKTKARIIMSISRFPMKAPPPTIVAIAAATPEPS